MYHRLVVAKAATLAPHALTSILVKSTGPKIKVIKPIEDSGSRTPLHIAREIADVNPDKPFSILLTNMSNKPVHVLKCLIMAHVTDSPVHVIATEATLLDKDSETIGTVHHKPLVNKDSQLTSQKDVKVK